MARFSPFRALRFASTSELCDLSAPPYDVVSSEDVAHLRRRHERNIVHIDVPADPDRYERAGRLLREWCDEGVFTRDDDPSFTIYRMRHTDETGRLREQVGVLGALEVVDTGAGRVLPHERTTPKASTDRLDLTRSTQANLSPVWGLSLARGLTDALTAPGDPLGSVLADGVEHIVERVTDPMRVAEISAIIGADDVLIADGHHRYGIARVYRDEVRAATGRTDTDAESTLAFVGELVPDQVAIAAIHRVYCGSVSALRSALGAVFDLTPGPPVAPSVLDEMDSRGALLLVERDGSGGDEAAGDALTTTWLTPRAGAFDGIRALDGAWLEHALDGVDVQVDYQHGVDAAAQAVRSGRVDAAVLIRPTSIVEIERTAREGLLMPPKSTYFTPKLLTGLVVRPLDL